MGFIKYDIIKCDQCGRKAEWWATAEMGLGLIFGWSETLGWSYQSSKLGMRRLPWVGVPWLSESWNALMIDRLPTADLMIPACEMLSLHKPDVSPPTLTVTTCMYRFCETGKKGATLTRHPDRLTILHQQWDFIHNLFPPTDQNISFCWVYVQWRWNRPAMGLVEERTSQCNMTYVDFK